MSTASIRFALLAAALTVSGALQAQAPAPAANPPAATTAAPATTPAATQPAPGTTFGPKEGQPAMTPQTTAPDATDAAGQAKKKRPRGSNFMPANPDASPVVPGQTGRTSAPSGTAKKSDGSAAAASSKAAGPDGKGASTSANAAGRDGGRGKAGRGTGMQRAFQDYQTSEEFAVYAEKAKGVQTVAECQKLLESTKKELEPRAKAKNATLKVDSTEICGRAQKRGRLKAS